jgi:hypothetical protein
LYGGRRSSDLQRLGQGARPRLRFVLSHTRSGGDWTHQNSDSVRHGCV